MFLKVDQSVLYEHQGLSSTSVKLLRQYAHTRNVIIPENVPDCFLIQGSKMALVKHGFS